MNKKRFLSVLLALLLLCGTAGCANTSKEQSRTPTVITVWHYYNGNIKSIFDDLVSEFNKTVGAENGVIVDAYSQGDVNQLADRVLRSAHDEVGAEAMPHMFAAYSDNAYRVDELGKVATLDSYITDEELAEYREEFIEDGRFTAGGRFTTGVQSTVEGKLKIFPIAKATENLFLNQTDFDVFAKATGADISKLTTWEGVAEIAAEYYHWTDAQTENLDDGKAFFGIDSMANFMLLSSMQLGQEIYDMSGDSVALNFSKETARHIWDAFYVPFVQGHYAALGRFRSDDAKSGGVLAYIGSTSGAGYFPVQIETGLDTGYPIECKVLPYPYYTSGKPYSVQQGAGMVVTKTEPKYEEACVLFLKWITSYEPNVRFAASTGYLPVKNEALQDLSKLMDGGDANNRAAVAASAAACQQMMESYRLYGNKPFDGSFETRKILESSLLDRCKQDLAAVRAAVDGGTDMQTALQPYLSDESFEQWYTEFTTSIVTALSTQK